MMMMMICWITYISAELVGNFFSVQLWRVFAFSSYVVAIAKSSVGRIRNFNENTFKTVEINTSVLVSCLHLRRCFHFKNKLILLLMTAMIWCVFNLSWAPLKHVGHMHAAAYYFIGNVFIQRLQTFFLFCPFYVFNGFLIPLWTFFLHLRRS